MSAVTDSMSRASYVAKAYEDIMCACPLMPALFYGGVDQYGRSTSGLCSDACALGGGARHEKDGLDSSVTQWNPWTEIGDVESLEMPMPLLYLGRRHVIDSGGFGKNRGGAGAQGTFVLHGSPFLGVGGIGSGTHVSGTPGIFGGYPAAVVRNDIIRNTDFKERVKEQKPIPHRVIDFDDPECIKGTPQPLFNCFPIQPMQENDMVGIHLLGGGGSGDCIERDPKLIVEDLENELTSLRAAKEIYCVAIDPETLAVDYEKTNQMRQSRIKERISKGIPAKQYVQQMVKKRKDRKLPQVVLEFLDEMTNYSKDFVESLKFEEKFAESQDESMDNVTLKKDVIDLSPYIKIMEDDKGKKVSVCSKCSYIYCDAQENFKLYSLIYDRDPKEIQPGRSGPNKDWMIYREFYCPQCGAQIEVEGVPEGIPILNNIKLKGI
jgi:N-methylhydantoinase B/oxoprolinase/acetone carboxylase alpha subunit